VGAIDEVQPTHGQLDISSRDGRSLASHRLLAGGTRRNTATGLARAVILQNDNDQDTPSPQAVPNGIRVLDMPQWGWAE